MFATNFSRDLLSNRVIRRVLLAGLTGYLIRFIDITVLSWLVVDRFDNPSAAGMLVFFRFLPFLLFGPIIGSITDKIPPIRIIFVVQPVITLLMVSFGIVLIFEFTPLWMFFGYSFLIGLGFCVESVARRLYLLKISPGTNYFIPVIAIETITMDIGWFLGSNLGGTLLSFSTPYFIYVGFGLLILGNLIILRGLPILFDPTESLANESFIGSIKSGFNYAKTDSSIIQILAIVGLINIFGFITESLGPTIIRNHLKFGELMFGLLLSGSGLGSVIGALIFSTVGIKNKKGLVLVLSAFGMFVFQFMYSFIGNPYLLLFICILSGFGWAGFMIFNAGLLMSKTQESFRGRIQGLQTLLIGLFPIGAIAFGFIGDYFGPLNALRLASILGSIGLLVIIFMGPKIISEE